MRNEVYAETELGRDTYADNVAEMDGKRLIKKLTEEENAAERAAKAAKNRDRGSYSGPVRSRNLQLRGNGNYSYQNNYNSYQGANAEPVGPQRQRERSPPPSHRERPREGHYSTRRPPAPFTQRGGRGE
jgi:hypothetical protein